MSIFLTDGSRDAELHIVIVEHRLPTDGSVREAPSSGTLVP